MEYVYTPATDPMGIDGWPTLSEMILTNKRVVIMLEYDANQQQVPWLLNMCSYKWQTPFSSTNPEFPYTVQRPPSQDRNTSADRLYLANHNLNAGTELFGQQILIPNTAAINNTNSNTTDEGAALTTIEQCTDLVANVELVDFMADRYDAATGARRARVAFKQWLKSEDEEAYERWLELCVAILRNREELAAGINSMSSGEDGYDDYDDYRAIIKTALRAEKYDREEVHIPALAELANIYPEHRFMMNALITIILASYLVFEIGQEPQPNNDLRRPLIDLCYECRRGGTTCIVCPTLNHFLASPTESRFVSSEWDKRQRLHRFVAFAKIPESIVKVWTAPTKESRSHQLKLKKVDYGSAQEHQGWQERKMAFITDTWRVVELQSNRSDEQIFGCLYRALASADKHKIETFLQEVMTRSLSNYRFVLDSGLAKEFRQSSTEIIRQRGGSVVSRGLSSTAHNRSDDTLSADSRTVFVVANSESQHISSGATRTRSVTITQSEFETFIAKPYGETLIERLAIPNATVPVSTRQQPRILPPPCVPLPLPHLMPRRHWHNRSWPTLHGRIEMYILA
ncbi:hypothetical protein OHC33_003342 [Knufia fluminis]|uniref:BRCT domain-containing protein n=1 Tax=Knufia fluminis TaxID=191047 RepID=A0AAN8I9K6_9EURO|nr:hypothetical protein OHC33_003342 [Knufia fluminis]